MKEPEFSKSEQKELQKLARVATGPQIGDSSFWRDVLAHLDAIGDEHPMVKPRSKKN